jgi:hypothetical protein
MEKRSGFKECPKCGLRNKPSAVQCDFCGQNLGPSDDWQQHIKDLESLNKMELRRPLDDRTSKRIESTIIRKDAPVTRNVEIREAGNIGKVLREMETHPDKDRGREIRDDSSRYPPAQDKLRIKDASSVPLVEKELEESPPHDEGATIADILKGASSEPEVAEPKAEPLTAESVEPLEPPMVEEVEAPEKEASQETAPVAEATPEPSTTEVLTPEDETLQAERSEVPSASSDSPETSEEMVPAVEATVEVVQPLQEEAAPDETIQEEETEVAISNDSHETIKLKLVEVERPKERLVPMMATPHIGLRGTAAIAMLALGTVAYLIILGMTAAGVLDAMAGLGGGAVSSFMMICGAAVVIPTLRRKKEDEVYICPKCHEKVGESSESCPACGAEFEYGE